MVMMMMMIGMQGRALARCNAIGSVNSLAPGGKDQSFK